MYVYTAAHLKRCKSGREACLECATFFPRAHPACQRWHCRTLCVCIGGGSNFCLGGLILMIAHKARAINSRATPT